MNSPGSAGSVPVIEIVGLNKVYAAGTPAEVGHAALFLASEEASYITGQIFFVDGGRMLC